MKWYSVNVRDRGPNSVRQLGLSCRWRASAAQLFCGLGSWYVPTHCTTVYSSVTHFSETSRFPVLSLCLLLVALRPRCGPRSYSKFRAFRPRRGLQSGQQRRARTRRPTTMARQKQSSTSSRPRKRSRGSTASPSSSNGNNLNNGMHCACVFHVAYSTCART